MEDWDSIARSLNFADEKDMWTKLYPRYSISKLHDFLGFGAATIRRRLVLSDIDRRPRGGARLRAEAQRKLLMMDPRVAVYGPSRDAAVQANLNSATVYHFRLWYHKLGKEMYEK